MSYPAAKALLLALPLTPYPFVGTREPCGLCASKESRVVSRWDRRLKRLTTVICWNCGLLRTDPMPTDEELKEYYARQYRFDYQLSLFRPPRHHRLRGAKRAKRRADFLAPVLSPGVRVLDVGCGAGEFLKEAAARGCRPFGLEPGAVYANCARAEAKAEVFEGGWQDASWPAASFDVVAAHHVLEHLRRPAEALRRFAEWLAPGGAVYVSVPDVSAGDNPAYERLHFAHVHGFTQATLLRAARAAGLIPDERFALSGATVALRKRTPGDPQPQEISAAAEIFAAMRRVDPRSYIFGFGFLPSMIRRNASAVFDGIRADRS
jgi:2-polyprenyl-3-methyl-5-hydroxy-6-metoxy-1,4-benzoquinol methylase